MDIEVFSPLPFPDPLIADAPVSLITIFDSISGIYYTFGTKEYYGSENIIYKQFDNEFEMLRGFMKFWRKDFPDVVTTWYGDGFDIPYLMNRMNKLFEAEGMYDGEQASHRFSPVGYSYFLKDVKRRFNDNPYDQLWTIRGVATMDYQYTYKVFTKDKRQSYSLNNICLEELKEGKLEHDKSSLSELYEKEYDKYVDYNVQDVRLLVKLEEKLRLLELCRRISCAGLSPIKEAEGTVGVITSIIAQKAMEHERIIPTFFFEGGGGEFEGGYVKPPVPSIARDLLYFDANSLYPNTIVTLNLSPETKMGTFIPQVDKSVLVTLKSGKQYTLTPEVFDSFVKKEKLVTAESGVLFSQKTKGILPEIVEDWYSERQKLQREIKRLSKELKAPNLSAGQQYLYRTKISQYETHQYTWKILLNKIYGFLGAQGSPCYDIELASAITATGRACDKMAATTIQEFAKSEWGIDEDIIVYGDTDSVILTIRPILKKLGLELRKDKRLNPEVYEIVKKIKIAIDTRVNDWAINTLNSKNPKYVFKIENISAAGLFIKKKRYVLQRIADEDGNPYYDDNNNPLEYKYKYTGFEVVSTLTPKVLKPIIKNLVESIIDMGDPALAKDLLYKAFEQYEKFTVEEVAITQGLNNYVKYEALCEGFNFGKRTPKQVKAAISHNRLIRAMGLENKYELLKDGDKIRVFYVKPNKYGMQAIAFGYTFPKEFDFLEMDKKTMFDKSVLAPVKRIFDIVKWDIVPPTSKERNPLLLMFS